MPDNGMDGVAGGRAHGHDTPLIVLQERRGAAPVSWRGFPGLYQFATLLPDRGPVGQRRSGS
jgi:catechol-2,3-dioxygenase